MAEGLNKVMLLGSLGADPELRFTQGGQAVLHIRLATSESYLDKDKVRRERTDWHNVTVWGKRGEALSKILTRGLTIFVEGSLRTSSYDDRDGNKRHKTEINANNVILTGGGGRSRGPVPDDAGDDGQSEQRAAQRDTGKMPPRNSPPPEGDSWDGGYGGGGSGGDDDIPFVFIGAAPEGEGIPKHWL